MLMQQDRAAPAHGQDGLSAPFPNRTQLLSLAFVPSVPHVKKYSLMLCEVFLGGPGCLNDKHSTSDRILTDQAMLLRFSWCSDLE